MDRQRPHPPVGRVGGELGRAARRPRGAAVTWRPRTSRMLGALLCVVLAAGPGVASAASVPAPKSLKQWSAAICSGVARWPHQITLLASTGPVGHLLHGAGVADDPETIRLGIPTFLESALVGADRLASDVQAAGVPKIKDGPAITASFADAVRVLTIELRAFKVRADQLPPNEPGLQFSESEDLPSLLDFAGSVLSTTVTKTAAAYPTSGLAKAFASRKACKPLL